MDDKQKLKEKMKQFKSALKAAGLPDKFSAALVRRLKAKYPEVINIIDGTNK